MSDGIVKGYRWRRTGTIEWHYCMGSPFNASDVECQGVSLIPDDGSMVVVSREEWERKREAAERILFNFLISYDSGGCCSPGTSTQEVEAHAERLAVAILGTNGGGE